MKLTQRVSNSFRDRTRFKIAIIGYSGVIICGILKNWFQGISETMVATAAGIVTSYIIGDSMRPSNKNGNQPPPEIPIKEI